MKEHLRESTSCVALYKFVVVAADDGRMIAVIFLPSINPEEFKNLIEKRRQVATTVIIIMIMIIIYYMGY